jgi:hypothetical protein
MLKPTIIALSLALGLTAVGRHSPRGPFNPEAWPPSIDRSKVVAFVQQSAFGVPDQVNRFHR